MPVLQSKVVGLSSWQVTHNDMYSPLQKLAVHSWSEAIVSLLEPVEPKTSEMGITVPIKPESDFLPGLSLISSMFYFHNLLVHCHYYFDIIQADQ